MAERARREGLLALEDAAKEVEHPFLRRGLMLAIDGTDPEELNEILHGEVDAKRKADTSGAKIFADMGGYAPTIGIIGTVLGLVHVLANLSQPNELGKLIASAFIATLWGVLTANVIWLPIGNRLKRLSELECAQMELAIEGIMAIQAGANPRLVAQRLKSLLPPEAEQKAKAA
jgi:chemotaxis protein MotA